MVAGAGAYTSPEQAQSLQDVTRRALRVMDATLAVLPDTGADAIAPTIATSVVPELRRAILTLHEALEAAGRPVPPGAYPAGIRFLNAAVAAGEAMEAAVDDQIPAALATELRVAEAELAEQQTERAPHLPPRAPRPPRRPRRTDK